MKDDRDDTGLACAHTHTDTRTHVQANFAAIERRPLASQLAPLQINGWTTWQAFSGRPIGAADSNLIQPRLQLPRTDWPAGRPKGAPWSTNAKGQPQSTGETVNN